MYDFLEKYFITTSGYNMVNTFTYSILLVVVSYFVFLTLKKMKINIDKKLFISVIPFIVFGSALRVLKDANIIHSYFFMTPFIYIIIFSITFSVLIFSKLLEKKKKIPYFKTMLFIGFLLTIIPLSQIHVLNTKAIFYVALFFIPWLVLIKFIPFNLTDKFPIIAQTFDGNVTFISLYFFNYWEQHVLPNFIFETFHSIYSFVLVKFFVVFSIIYILNNYSKEKELNEFVKLIIMILGFSTSFRDLLRLLFFV